MKKRNIILIVPDIRSIHNVGSLLRTAEGLGIDNVILCGYTPHPEYAGDSRLPHVQRRQTSQIAKTALGAEKTDIWSYQESIADVIQQVKSRGYSVQALEQSPDAVPLPDFIPGGKLAIVLGSEVEGLTPELIEMCDGVVEIPMFGTKESYNVVEAATMCMYHCRFFA